MAFVGDYFSHKSAVKSRVEQLENLNMVINERKGQAYEASEELRGLEDKIKEIKAMFPGISEAEAWEKYTAFLKQQNQILENDIASKRKELANLLAKLDIALEIDRIAMEKDRLKQELTSLEEYKKSLIKIGDIIFALYALPNGELVVNAFIYLEEEIYRDGLRLYKGKKYKSISGNRILGLDFEQADSLIADKDDRDDKYIINTSPSLWFNFEDACFMLDSLQFLGKRSVSIEEINEVLQLFIDNYDFVKDDDGVKALSKKVKIKRS